MRCVCCEQEIKDEEIRYYLDGYPPYALFLCERCGNIFCNEIVKELETTLLRGEEIEKGAEDRKKRELFKRELFKMLERLPEEGKRFIQEYKEKQHGQRQD